MKKTLYEISVWDISEGGLIAKIWEADEVKLADVKERYEGWPYDIIINKKWEVEEIRTETRYQITVWNASNGDVVKYYSNVSEQEYTEILEYWSDEPFCEVGIDRTWEEEIDE